MRQSYSFLTYLEPLATIYIRRITHRAAPPISASDYRFGKSRDLYGRGFLQFRTALFHQRGSTLQGVFPNEPNPQSRPRYQYGQTAHARQPKSRNLTKVSCPPSKSGSDLNSAIPQLLKIDDVCKILALEKSAIYNLVANGELRRPLEFGTSRRAASRWLLGDVLHFVQSLSNNRPIPDSTKDNCSTTDLA